MTKLVPRAFIVIASILILVSCGKTLPKEEQQRLQDAANSRKIQRVTESQMVEFVQSRAEELIEITKSGDSEEVLSGLRDILGEDYPASYVLPTESSSDDLREVLEAYMFSVAEGSGVGANLQIIDEGNILYTIPHIEDSSGIKMLRGIWKIEFIRKNMVNEISKNAD